MYNIPFQVLLPISLDTNYIAGKLIIKETPVLLTTIMWTQRSGNPITYLVYPCLCAKQNYLLVVVCMFKNSSFQTVPWTPGGS